MNTEHTSPRSPENEDGGALLRTSGLTVRFGGLVAVNDVDLEVRPGELVGLIGPNGAGKTTCIDALTGFVPSTGVVRFLDQDISRLPPQRRARAGLGRTFQSLELFGDLTVEENLLVAAERPRWWAPLADVVAPRRRCASDALEWSTGVLGIEDLMDAMPDDLSLGQRKLVGVARALVGEPRVVLMDEPAAGLDSDESLVLGQAIQRVVAHGTSVLLIDHDMGLVLGICPRIYVLEFGTVIAHGSTDTIRSDPRVREAYLGVELAEDG
jgi:ABC-type branched-subunit amino acid transport system ATPase component